uniref:CRAL-TRIO domain-containing protein n=1 Tax=Glossina brevipalpis TaxID=37001 RepID=A0A1A9W9W1_9MUSC
MSNIRPLSACLAKKAKIELGEVADRIDEDIAILKDWICSQPHLQARLDDQLLVAFLRGCKYSLQKSKQKIDYFYSMRNAVPELYKNRFVNEKTLTILRKGGILRLLKPLSEDGPRIHIARYTVYDMKEYPLAEILKVRSIISDIQLLEDDNAIIAGFIEIVDMQDFSASHMFQFDPLIVKKIGVLAEKAWPLRTKGVHIINAPPTAEKLLSLSKNLMSEKIKQRFHIHQNYGSLYRYVPQECLPHEYGGSNGMIKDIIASWEENVIRYKDYFKDEIKYGSNEKLRPGEPLNSQSLFGLEGSFRKLEVD